MLVEHVQWSHGERLRFEDHARIDVHDFHVECTRTGLIEHVSTEIKGQCEILSLACWNGLRNCGGNRTIEIQHQIPIQIENIHLA